MTTSNNGTLLTPEFYLSIDKWIELNVLEDIKVNKLKGYNIPLVDTDEMATYAKVLAKGGSIPDEIISDVIEYLLAHKVKYRREIKSVANRRLELQRITKKVVHDSGIGSRTWIEEYDPTLFTAIQLVETGYLKHISTRKLYILTCFYYIEKMRERLFPSLKSPATINSIYNLYIHDNPSKEAKREFFSCYEDETITFISDIIEPHRLARFFQLRRECILQINGIFNEDIQRLIGTYFRLLSINKLYKMTVIDKKIASDRAEIMNECLSVITRPPSFTLVDFEERYEKLTNLLIRIYKAS